MTETEYRNGCVEIEGILEAHPDPAVDSPEGLRVVALVQQLAAYEVEHFLAFKPQEQDMDDTELDAVEAIWLNHFLEENWSRFLHFMQERDGEEAAYKLVKKLVAQGNK